MAITREIDQSAQNILKISLPQGWLFRKQDPDIYIDYVVEFADGSGPLGNIFGVQLKGTISPKYSGKFIKYSLKTKHIIYYLDKVKYPVFLIVIDVRAKRGYYIFVQEWSKKLINSAWRNQDYITLTIPVKNSITDIEKFKSAIFESENYMRDLWPSSIDSAIDYEKKRLEDLDPRFGILISHNEGQTKVALHAKENVNLKCKIKSDKKFKKNVIDFYNKGLPFTIEQTDVLGIYGSKIIEEAFEKATQGKITIGPITQKNCLLIISTLNELNQTTSTNYLNGVIFGGRKEFRIQGQLNESLFKVNILGKLGKKKLLSFDFEFDFEFQKWEGLPITDLPFFEKIYSFLIAMRDGNIIKMVCEIRGKLFVSGTSYEVNYEAMKNLYNFFDIINKAIVIAKIMDIKIVLPNVDSISRDDVKNIELIYELLKNQECRSNGSETVITGKLISIEKFIESFGPEATERILKESLCIEIPEVKYNIFGKEIIIGPIRYTLTNPRLFINISEKYFKLRGTENSEFIVNKLQKMLN